MSNITAPEVDEHNEPFTNNSPAEVNDRHIQKPGGTQATEDKSKDDNGGLGDNSTNQAILDGKPDQAQHREAISSEQLVSENDDQAVIDTQLQEVVEHTIVHVSCACLFHVVMILTILGPTSCISIPRTA